MGNPWEQRKLRDISERVRGNDGRMDLPVLTISAGNGWMSQEDRFSRNIAGTELKNYTLLKFGELSYNHGNSKLAKYGAVFDLNNYKEALVPRVYHSFRMNYGNPGFIKFLFESKKPDKELSKLISSGARMDGLLNISYDEFANISLLVPEEEEQNRISFLLRKLDDTIALHQRKLELLKEKKKAYLQKMFPYGNHKCPKYRFPEFTDPWEQRKFMDVIRKITDFRGRTPKKLGMDWSETGVLALSALNVKQGYIDFSVDPHYGDWELYQKWMSGNELHKGQVIFTTEAPMGNVAQIPDDKPYILSQRTIAFEPDRTLLTEEFLMRLLQSPNVQNVLESFSSGGTAKGVSQKSLEGLTVQFPSGLKEQQQIGTFFQKLDDTIALHQRMLELLNIKKKAYLQRMFPSGDDNEPKWRFKEFA